ncbi:hypothetical protein QBC32DRAFT_357772 [Pseudoneurospora amorphoporcata]|uniref:Uncharacterized protein n=1 Tax=Pseudoneurospora amorphoporcata TaxID=241081 RepID=A0AAN6SAZ1_9PEZI|nr:hypothetical protein QBC32DRAFT_357772 [Pseudoneurospora amorphoporcata]
MGLSLLRSSKSTVSRCCSLCSIDWIGSSRDEIVVVVGWVGGSGALAAVAGAGAPAAGSGVISGVGYGLSYIKGIKVSFFYCFY